MGVIGNCKRQKIKCSELPSRARRIVQNGDVILATVRPNLQGYALCTFHTKNVLCSTGFALISPSDIDDAVHGKKIIQVEDPLTGEVEKI